MTLAGDVPGCLDTIEISVCHRPQVAIIDLPVFASPLGGLQISTLAAGQNFCRQSVPQFSGCSRNLNLRAAEGYNAVWGYMNTDGRSGWVWGPGLADNNGFGGCCGPAGEDFRCGDDKAGVCPSPPRDGGTIPATAVSGVRGFKTTTYLRYAPQSTPFYYLVPGCTVEQYRRADNYASVRVIEGGGYALKNVRGWVLSSGFLD